MDQVMFWILILFYGGVTSMLVADGRQESKEQFKCQHGPSIEALRRCDAVTDCDDGSDETVRACADVRCPSFTFQCAYGACVDQGSECDGKRDCPDGSDEDIVLCGRTRVTVPTPSGQGPCALPPYPKHGSYVVIGRPDIRSEKILANVTLAYSCDTGYGIVGKDKISCFNGSWPYAKPQCLRLCRLDPHPSVEYLCFDPNSNTTRPCDRNQASGARVFPQCRASDYYSRQILSPMTCIEGSWDYIAICRPDCGRMSANDREFSMRQKVLDDLSWHVRVYRESLKNNKKSYKQICSGSIISREIVVSAARCFRSDGGEVIQPAEFLVAAGKSYQSWKDARDRDAETRDVAEIKIHPGFRGAQTDYQNDIALLTLSEPLPYKSHIRPVCIDFDESFESQQLQRGTMARVASRVFSQNAFTFKSLRVVELLYVHRDECSTRDARLHNKYFTDDKICAGSENEMITCIQDNGAGLAFLDTNSEEKRYYLRGVLSVPVRTCDSFRIMSFTSIARQELFIKDHIDPSLIGRITEKGACRLPPYPEHGGYAVSGRTEVRPGDTFEAFFLTYTCESDYVIVGKREIYCFNGYWPRKSPYCIECGLETPAGRALIIDGAPAMRPELPWHTGVYRKGVNGTHELICGGTIVSNTVVVSAAHCFWSDIQNALLPSSRFAVAVGKLHRAWASPGDPDVQTRDVAEIKIPTRFRGALTNFQDDIALVVLSSPLDYQTYVRPVCLSFDEHLEKKQLRSGHMGKVAGWGYTSESGHPADTLRVATLPYVDIDRCLAQAPPTFYQYITSDKICAGYTNGTALCMGDSGGGLVFPKINRKVTRYYLRGVVSTAPNNERACNVYAITSFTQITKHESFIRQSLGDVFL